MEASHVGTQLQGFMGRGVTAYLESTAGLLYRLLACEVHGEPCVLIDSHVGLRVGAPTVCARADRGVRITDAGRFVVTGVALGTPTRRGGVAQPIQVSGVVDVVGPRIALLEGSETGSLLEARFATELLRRRVDRASVGFLYTHLRLATSDGTWFELLPDGTRLGAWTIGEYPVAGGCGPRYPVNDLMFDGPGSMLVATTSSGVLRTAPVMHLHARQWSGTVSGEHARFDAVRDAAHRQAPTPLIDHGVQHER
jgi:hypothetical protein